MKAIILISEASLPLAKTLQRELPDTLIYTKNECEGCISITSCHRFIEEHFNDFDSIIFIGAIGLSIVAIIPIFFSGAFGADVSFGGTSLIIIVGVVLETLKQIESQMLVRHYRGFISE